MNARLAVLGLVATCAVAQPFAVEDEWRLTAAEYAALERGEVLIETRRLGERRAAARAAVRIAASPKAVFAIMTSCAEALRFAPHLQRCRVLESAADGSWQLIEQEADYGWYAPAMRYAFRAEYVPGESVRFRNVQGDFREHEGMWRLAATGGGAATVVTYSVRIAPRFFVPRRFVQSALESDLPAMLAALRRRCERGRSRRLRRPRSGRQDAGTGPPARAEGPQPACRARQSIASSSAVWRSFSTVANRACCRADARASRRRACASRLRDSSRRRRIPGLSVRR